MSNANFADVNGQHLFYRVHGAGKPLVLLHGGINPDSNTLALDPMLPLIVERFLGSN